MAEFRYTTRIYLWGGPGSGKSTLAAEIFAYAKREGASIELVREYAKELVWEGKPLDQYELLAEQSRRENILFGKVDYLVTDSPWPLGAVYGSMYGADAALVQSIREGARSLYATNPVCHVFVNRSKLFVQEGRNENETQARQVDVAMRNELAMLNQRYMEVDSSTRGSYVWAQIQGRIHG